MFSVPLEKELLTCLQYVESSFQHKSVSLNENAAAVLKQSRKENFWSDCQKRLALQNKQVGHCYRKSRLLAVTCLDSKKRSSSAKP